MRRVDPRREQHREDRGGGLDDGGEPRVQPRLREAQEPERERVVQRAEHQERDDHRADVGDDTADDDEGEQHHEADREAAEGDHGGLDLLDAQLDEEERRAPDRRQGQQERDVSAGHRSTLVRRRGAAVSHLGDLTASAGRRG